MDISDEDLARIQAKIDKLKQSAPAILEAWMPGVHGARGDERDGALLDAYAPLPRVYYEGFPAEAGELPFYHEVRALGERDQGDDCRDADYYAEGGENGADLVCPYGPRRYL